MEAYHDAEWGVPVHDPRMLWEMLVLEGFQAGLSWRTILHRREGFRAAFDNFDPAKIARYDAAKVDALMQDPGIIRARAKIEATIGNARIYLAMAEAGEDFSAWVWGLAGGAPQKNDGIHVPASTPVSDAMSKALKKKGFKFVGATIAYAWMQAVGMVNDHAPHCFRRDQV
jgi:DNA-3-methyladenine glycosylase I